MIHDFGTFAALSALAGASRTPRHFVGSVGLQLGRRMFKRQLGVSCLLDLDHERHSSLGTPKREAVLWVFS